MTLFSKKMLCPYCYNEFKESQIEWRCNSSRCSKPENLEEDTKFGEYHEVGGASKKMPRIIPRPFVKRGEFVQCEKCKEFTNVRLCPECHSILPQNSENIIISIVGAQGAGKSYYVGGLLRQLNLNLAKFNCGMQFTTTEAESLYKKRYKDKFDAREQLESTRPARGVNIVGANLPILCDLKDRKLHSRTFTFFDAAGENFDDVKIMKYVSPYISHCSGIILLLDPTQIPRVREQLNIENPNAGYGSNDKRISYETILLNTVEVIHNHTRKNGIIKIPLAIGFSKWDLIENSPNLKPREGSWILKNSPHFIRGFDNADCENVSNEIKGLLSKWDYTNFITLAEQNFQTVRFFGFSAIGADINPDGTMPNIISKRVEDPFLWILNELKMIVK